MKKSKPADKNRTMADKTKVNAEKPILHRKTYFLPNSTEIRICLAKSGDGDDKHLFCVVVRCKKKEKERETFVMAISPLLGIAQITFLEDVL